MPDPIVVLVDRGGSSASSKGMHRTHDQVRELPGQCVGAWLREQGASLSGSPLPGRESVTFELEGTIEQLTHSLRSAANQWGLDLAPRAPDDTFVVLAWVHCHGPTPTTAS